VVGASQGQGPELFHGYTYSGHPAACAAALASLDIYRDEDLFGRGRQLAPYFMESLSGLRGLPQVSDLRGYGLLSGIQLTPGTAPGAKGARVQRALYDAGLHVKTTGDAIIFAPALVASRMDVDAMFEVLKHTLAQESL
jgi:beta-alanine--pyruvate transaminase